MAISGFGGLVNNPLEVLGNDLTQLPDMEQKRRQLGVQALQPYYQALTQNPALKNDPGFMSRIRRIGGVYGIPVDAFLNGGAGTQAQPGTQPGGQPGAQQQTQPPGTTPGEAPGQAQPQAQPGAQPGGAGGGITPQQIQAMAPFIKVVKQNPKALQSPAFLKAATARGQQVGLTPQHLQELLKKVMPGGAGGGDMQPGGGAGVQGSTAAQLPNQPGGAGVQPTPGSVQQKGASVQQGGVDRGMSAFGAFLGEKPMGLQAFGTIELNKEQLDYIRSTNPGPERVAAYANVGIDPKTVPDYVLTANKYVDPQVQTRVFNDTWMRITGLVKQGAGPDTISGLIRSAGVIDPALGASLSSDPSIVSGLRDSANAELQQLEESGIYKKAEAARATAQIGQAQSVEELNAAHAGLFRAQATVLPMEAQARVTSALAASTRAAAYVKDVQQRTENAQNGTAFQQYQMRMGTVKQMRATYNSADAAYNHLLQTTLSSGVNPLKVKIVDPTTKQVTTLNQELITAKQARDDAAEWLRASGNPMVTRGVVQSAINHQNAGSGMYTKNPTEESSASFTIQGQTFHAGDTVQTQHGLMTVGEDGKLYKKQP